MDENPVIPMPLDKPEEVVVDFRPLELEIVPRGKGVDVDPAQKRETVRGTIALSLVALFAATVLLTVIGVLLGANWENLKGALELLLPAETALLGTAIGFYFGAESRERLPADAPEPEPDDNDRPAP